MMFWATPTFECLRLAHMPRGHPRRQVGTHLAWPLRPPKQSWRCARSLARAGATRAEAPIARAGIVGLCPAPKRWAM